MSILDKRIKAVLPSMGNLFSESSAAVLRNLGWNAEALSVCDREALELGRSVTTSKECLPVINIIGQVLKYLKHRKNPGEKLVVVMVGAAGNCRVGQYEILIRTTVEKLKYTDVALIVLKNDDGFAGLGLKFRLAMVKALYIFDPLADVRAAIKALALDVKAGMEVFDREAQKLIDVFDGKNRAPIYRQLRRSVAELSRIPLRTPISQAKYIGVLGEIFVRRDHFCLMGIPEKLAEQNFVMLIAPVTEVIRYTDFLHKIGSFTADASLIGKLEMLISVFVQNHHEKKAKRIIAKSGLYEYDLIHIEKYIDHSTHIIPRKFTGDPGLTTGMALFKMLDKYCGTISVGPFGCMNSRMTESVATAEMTVEGKERASRNAGVATDLAELKKTTETLPFLAMELDGNPFSQIEEARFETFLLQADRLHAEMMKMRGNGNGNGRGTP